MCYLWIYRLKSVHLDQTSIENSALQKFYKIQWMKFDEQTKKQPFKLKCV